MDASSQRWTTVSDSEFAHEREGLAFLRRMLPDRDPIHVWSNFQFVAKNGALYEVDALVLTSAGLFLVEIKSHPGEMGGDGATWFWTRPNGSYGTLDNPRLLANKKAKLFKSLLGGTKALRRGKHKVPYVQELIFLSDPDLKATFAPAGRFKVHGRDADAEAGESEIPVQRRSLGGIVDALLGIDPEGSGHPKSRINRPHGEAIVEAVGQVGVRELSSRRRVGDYRLGELLDDVESDPDTGIAYQDFVATHTAAKGLRQRIRIYPYELNASDDERGASERAAKREFDPPALSAVLGVSVEQGD